MDIKVHRVSNNEELQEKLDGVVRDKSIEIALAMNVLYYPTNIIIADNHFFGFSEGLDPEKEIAEYLETLKTTRLPIPESYRKYFGETIWDENTNRTE